MRASVLLVRLSALAAGPCSRPASDSTRKRERFCTMPRAFCNQGATQFTKQNDRLHAARKPWQAQWPARSPAGALPSGTGDVSLGAGGQALSGARFDDPAGMGSLPVGATRVMTLPGV